MIIDLDKFIRSEEGLWAELEAILDRLERDPLFVMDLDPLKRFHYLHQRAAADLAQVKTFASEPELVRHLESLVARTYGEIHETREKAGRFGFRHWFFRTFPRTFRRHIRAFRWAVLMMTAGALFGGFALALDPGAREVLMPFPQLQERPSERVAGEEQTAQDRMEGRKIGFSAFLMTHNIRVSIFTLSLGMTWGIGTVLLLFFNGVMVGAVLTDYVLDGQTAFLFGWLLPHGSVEIPSILIAGQVGLMLANVLLGRDRKESLRTRFRQLAPDLVTLIAGLALLLVWAGFVEAFFSQYHEPVIPYAAKILFGAGELGLLALFLARSGLAPDQTGARP